MLISIEGFHGTSLKSAEAILNSNFQLSFGDKEWLGDGVYFFINGINKKPEEQAEKWAIAQSWNNVTKIYDFNTYCVLKSEIIVEENNFLDLTSEDGIEVFEYLIERFEEKIKESGKKLEYLDGLLINLARGEGILEVDVVKGNFYIKFALERIKRLNLRTNNCTICAVFKPKKNLKEIKITKLGKIKSETI
ncbi:hypothetical protein GW820_07165 [archaeon]|nr:hypothetical protein [archaeon]NCQ07559.1 hypothetical protein [archaeon]